MKWIGTQTIYDNVRFVKGIGAVNETGILPITAGDITLYDATNDGNPSISIGSSATERLEIIAEYESGAQGLDAIRFKTYTAGSSANDGRFAFEVDEVFVGGFVDDGLNIAQSKNLSIGGVDILTDSSGTTTLNNIDDLDATTIATFNSHLTAGDITSVVAGTNLSGGGTSGDVTLNVDDAFLKNNADDATTGTITAAGLIADGDRNITPSLDGPMIHVDTATLTDTNTSAEGTVASFGAVTIEGPTIAATNESTITTAATVYIKDAPTAGTNSTLTRPLALWVDSGTARFDGDIDLEGDMDVNGTLETDALTIGGAAVLAAATTSAVGAVELATIAETTTGTDTARAVTPDGLKDGYQGSSNVTTLGTIGTGVWNGTKITDIYTNTSGRRYGNTIKILPSDFMINDDAASPLSFKDGSNSGVHVNDADNEAIAFVTIPEGMKATHVDVYATHNKTLTVDELDVNSSYDFTGTARGTGSCNTQLDITDVNATATNFLAITVTLTATSNRIWGGIVTIAAQ